MGLPDVDTACNVSSMTTTTDVLHPLDSHTPVTHNRRAMGTGVVIGMIGNTTVVVQWPGLPMARREAREDVTEGSALTWRGPRRGLG